jgi:hypothetical protein
MTHTTSALGQRLPVCTMAQIEEDYRLGLRLNFP